MRLPNELRAYNVYPGDGPYDEGCVLVFAPDRNQAKLMAYRKGPFCCDYIDLKARRVTSFDKYAMGGVPCLHDDNEGLPEPFFDDEI